MNAIYDSHILRWKNVNWPADGRKLLDSIGQCKGREVLARVRQAGRMVEVQSPNGDFVQRLEQSEVNLGNGFDLEVITREPGFDRAAARPSKEEKTDEFVDRNDFNCLQWNGERGIGHLPGGRMRNTPMFFRGNGMNADLMDLYAGQTVFLVLNGGSLEGFDWSRLKKPGICTFGVNNGAHQLRPNFWTCVDDPTRFMRSIWADPTITKFVPMSHFQKPIWDVGKEAFSESKVRDFPNVYGYRRNEAFQAAQWLYEDTINWGNHAKRGGGRSVMLAALRIAFLLGFRRVCLLGCDFYMDDNNKYWFAEERSKHAISNNQNSYRLMMGYFEQLQPHFLAAGFHVVNCNPKSHLKAFPTADFDEELNAAQIDASANTEGMYVDRYKAQKQDAKPRAVAVTNPQPKPKTPAPKPGAPRPGLSQAMAKPVLTNVGGKLAAKVLDHLVEVVSRSSVQAEPFAHVELQRLFPEDVYRELMISLPQACHYQEMRHHDAIQPDGRSVRLRFSFTAPEIGRLPGSQQRFWSQIRAALHDRRLETAFRTVFREELQKRFGRKVASLALKPVPALVRDLKGSRMSVHPDIPKRAITAQFYLPADDAQKHMGTIYYRVANGQGHEKAKSISFMPASGHAFVVNERSLHGMEAPIAEGASRDSLMLTYFIKER